MRPRRRRRAHPGRLRRRRHRRRRGQHRFAGDRDGTAGPTPSPPTTAVATGIQHPLGAEDVVLSVGYEGGFVPVGVTFANLPTLLVTGDGTAIVTGPRSPSIRARCCPTCSSGRSRRGDDQALLRSADEHGLLADVSTPRNDMIADASDTGGARSAVDGTTYRTRPTPSASTTEDDPARAALAEFVAAPWRPDRRRSAPTSSATRSRSSASST